MDFWQYLTSGDDFMPRRSCGVWSPSLVGLHLVSDVVTWLAYLWIPIVMGWVYLAHRRALRLNTASILLLGLYGVFITACGWTHFFDALMFYNPVYRLNGVVRAVTAVVSLATAISLVRLLPQAVSLPVTLLTQKATLDQQRAWLRDILDAATGGVLRLCTSEGDLPAPLAPAAKQERVSTPADLRGVRRMVQRLCESAGFSPSRTQDLVSAVHESAMNALTHAGGGTVRANLAGDRVQVWVEDSGGGIPLDRLPISTLKQGYSTADSAGQGWYQLLSFAEVAYLHTGPTGTRVVLEMGSAPPPARIPFSRAVGGDVVNAAPA